MDGYASEHSRGQNVYWVVVSHTQVTRERSAGQGTRDEYLVNANALDTLTVSIGECHIIRVITHWSSLQSTAHEIAPLQYTTHSHDVVSAFQPEIPPVLSVKPETSEDLTNAQTLAMHMTDTEKERAVQQGHMQEVSDELCVGFWKQTRLMRMEGLPGECIGVSIVEVEKEKDYYSTNYCPVIGVSVLRMDAPADAQRPEVS
ncbi:hypothetical protein SARC_09512, partial [Sphaeroforma arctica JP610]